MSGEDHEPGKPPVTVQPDAYYTRHARREERRDRALIALFIVVTLFLFAGFFWLFVTGPLHR